MRQRRENRLIEQVDLTITDYRMLSARDRVLVAVSGGPDSTALLYALLELVPGYRLELGVFHLNHGLRPEAADEERHVTQVCNELGLTLFSRRSDVRGFCTEKNLGIQAGARELRYLLMREIAAEHGFTKIAVGHTADDVVETFLMRLVRGSGLKGLGAIPPVRDGDIIRPLIDITRRRILEWLESLGVDFIVDPSNTDLKYLRNRMRLELLPKLASYNPRISERILSTVRMIREEEALVAEIVDKTFSETAETDGYEVVFDLSDVEQLGPALGRRVIRQAVEIVGGARDGIDFDHFELIRKSLVCGEAGAVDLPDEIRALKEDGSLIIYKTAPPIPATEVRPGVGIGISGLEVSLTIRPRDAMDRLSGGAVVTDAADIDWPLIMRSAAPGDTFRPLGLGGTKNIHRFFIDSKIPRRRRPTIPVFVDREKVVAVGSRVDDRVKVTDKTEEIIVIEMSHTRGLEPS